MCVHVCLCVKQKTPTHQDTNVRKYAPVSLYVFVIWCDVLCILLAIVGGTGKGREVG